MSDEKARKTAAIISRLEKERGFVREWPRLLAERDPDFMELLHNVTTHVLHKRTSLPRKTKELLLIAINAFNFYEYGFRVHVRSALKEGTTEEELLETLELVGVLNVHGLSSLLPVLVEEVEKFKKTQKTPQGKKAKKTKKAKR